MQHTELGPVGIVAALALAVAQAASAETVVADFDLMPPDQPPAGFSTAVTGEGPAGRWLVRPDAEAPSGTQVLAQTSDEPRRAQFPLAIYDGLSAADVELSVKFKPISGATDQAAGLVWRYLDERNYYIVRANALEGNVVLYKVEDGERTDLPLLGQGRTYGADAAVPANAWGTLAVRVRAIASPLPSMARNCSRWRIRPSPRPARSGCGPRPTASPHSTI